MSGLYISKGITDWKYLVNRYGIYVSQQ